MKSHLWAADLDVTWVKGFLNGAHKFPKLAFGWRKRKADSPLHFYFWLLCQYRLAVAYHIMQLAPTQHRVKPTEKIAVNISGLEWWVLVMNILSSFDICSAWSWGRDGFKRQVEDPGGFWRHLCGRAQRNNLITWVPKWCTTTAPAGWVLGDASGLFFRSFLALFFVCSALGSTSWCA